MEILRGASSSLAEPFSLNWRRPFSKKQCTTRLRHACTPVAASRVDLTVWDVSELAVSIYPRFLYDAIGAGGSGEVIGVEGLKYHVRFEAAEFKIPPLDYRTAKVLGVPLPPPLRIDIEQRSLQGTVNCRTGEAYLHFSAWFLFSIGVLYRAAPLLIDTTLTTEASTGTRFQSHGTRLNDGRGKLVGVAQVADTQDPLLNAFLMLPAEALAELSVDFVFS